jgi:hypothetical protein
MNVGLVQSGAAIPRQAPVAPAQPTPVVRNPDGELPDVQPIKRTLEDPRGKLRDQVMTERGLNLASLMQMPPEARIQLEARIEGEVARRLGSPRLLDIRV